MLGGCIVCVCKRSGRGVRTQQGLLGGQPGWLAQGGCSPTFPARASLCSSHPVPVPVAAKSLAANTGLGNLWYMLPVALLAHRIFLRGDPALRLMY